MKSKDKQNNFKHQELKEYCCPREFTGQHREDWKTAVNN